MSDSEASAASLKVEADELRQFKKRIDGLLDDLDASQASPKQIKAQSVSSAAYGTGFPQVETIRSTYEKVHSRLEVFSAMLGAQIEALSITTDMARTNYESVEQDQVERLQALQRQMDRYATPASKTSPTNTKGTAGSGKSEGSM